MVLYSKQKPTSIVLKLFANPYQIVLILALAALLIFLILFPLRMVHDAGIYLDIGTRLLQGQRPYVDYFETNPPTFHYLNIIPVLVSQITHINVIFIFDLFVFAYLVFACLTVVPILISVFGKQDYFVVYIIPFILAFQSIQLFKQPNYGQREHFILLMLIPYLILRWHRWNGGNTNRVIAFIIGFNACIGATIKPFSLPMFIIADLYWLITKRKVSSLRQPEIYGAVTFAGLFVSYFGLINPQSISHYFSDLAPVLSGGAYDAYYAYGTPPTLINMVTRDVMLQLQILLGIVVCIFAFRSKHKLGSLLIPMSIVLWGAVIAFVIQRKGWTYHRIPVDGLAFILFMLVIYFALTTFKFSGRIRYAVVRHLWTLMLILLIIVVYVNNDMLMNTPLESSTPTFNAMIGKYTAIGDSVLVVDTEIYPSYPGLQQLSRTYASSYLSALLPAISYYGQTGPDLYNHPTYPAIVDTYISKTIQDIEQNHPRLILIHAGECFGCAPHFTFRDFLQSWGVMDIINAQYVLVSEAANYYVYQRR